MRTNQSSLHGFRLREINGESMRRKNVEPRLKDPFKILFILSCLWVQSGRHFLLMEVF